MDWLITAVGAVLVLLALNDVFHTLWHPSGQGKVTKLVMETVWALSRRGRTMRMLSGPVGMVLTVLTWAAMVIVGFASIYWAHMPEAFSFAPGLEPQVRNDAVDALYLSLVAVSTLGLGDVVAEPGWLRLAVPLQALVGFALLTAAVSWVLQVYSALARRRSLAVQLTALRHAGLAEQLAILHPVTAAQTLLATAEQLARVRVDLAQHSETYFFREEDDAVSLPACLAYARQLADGAARTEGAEVRLGGAVLGRTLSEFAALIAHQRRLGTDDPAEALRRYAAEHGWADPDRD